MNLGQSIEQLSKLQHQAKIPKVMLVSFLAATVALPLAALVQACTQDKTDSENGNSKASEAPIQVEPNSN